MSNKLIESLEVLQDYVNQASSENITERFQKVNKPKVCVVYNTESFRYEPTDKYIIKIFNNLSSANKYAERLINDCWQIQDGYRYERKERSDGTMAFVFYYNDQETAYYVEQYDLELE